METLEKKKTEITFINVTYQDIKSIVNIKKKDNSKKFDKWFFHKYEITEDEDFYLSKLIKNNKLYLQSFNEEQLKACFILPVLHKVDFIFGDIRDWYEYSISAKINNVTLKGKPDFMLAKGDFFPELPYFFIQEFKRSHSDSYPEMQLLAEMLVAIKINNKDKIQGCYIIGQHWFFLILEKLKNKSYEYFVHEGLNCLKINEIKQIFVNLQAVKVLFCKD